MTWSWERSPNGASSWTPISGETLDTYTPVAADLGDYLQATASYTDEVGPGKSAQAISANAVQGAPGRNKPVFEEGLTATRSVQRNKPAGVFLGAPFTATDADNDALTYSLGAVDRASFDIDSSTGQLRTNTLLTGIRRTSYSVFVSVSDGKNDLGGLKKVPRRLTPPPGVPVSDGHVARSRRTRSAKANIGAPVIAGHRPRRRAETLNADTTRLLRRGRQLQTNVLYACQWKQLRVAVSVRDSKDDEGNPDTTTDSTIAVTILVTEVNEPRCSRQRWPLALIPVNTTFNGTRRRNRESLTSADHCAGDRSPGEGLLRSRPPTRRRKAARRSRLRLFWTRIRPSHSDDPADGYAGGRIPENTPAPGSGDYTAPTDSLGCRTKAALDFETIPYYSVTVMAVDRHGRRHRHHGHHRRADNLDDTAGTVTLDSLQPLVGPLTATLDDNRQRQWQRDLAVGASLRTALPLGPSSRAATSATYAGAAMWATTCRPRQPPTVTMGNVGQERPAISANAVEVALGRNAPVFTEGASTTRSVPKPPQRAWISARRWRPPTPTTTS